MGDIVVEGFSGKDNASTTSLKEKNLSNYEQKYDKGTRKPIKDYIIPTAIAEDQDWDKSTINSGDENMEDMKTEKKKSTVPVPNRLSNLMAGRGILKNVLGIKEFRASGGILGKVKNKIFGKAKGAVMSTPESPKLFSGKFLDGSLKEALVMLVKGRSTGVEVKDPQGVKDKPRSEENLSVINHKDHFEAKNISVDW